MRLEDYIDKAKNPVVKKPKIGFAALELDYYDNISSEKKKLIEAVFNHLSKDDYYDVLDRYNKEMAKCAYYQSVSTTGVRGLIRIEICDLYGSYDLTRAIPKDKFFEDYNSRYMIGEQKYKEVKAMTHRDFNDSCFDRYMTLFYTADGGVFLGKDSAEEIEKLSLDKLGDLLANICINDEKDAARRKEFRERNKLR